jgi:hypothetical protein
VDFNSDGNLDLLITTKGTDEESYQMNYFEQIEKDFGYSILMKYFNKFHL